MYRAVQGPPPRVDVCIMQSSRITPPLLEGFFPGLFQVAPKKNYGRALSIGGGYVGNGNFPLVRLENDSRLTLVQREPKKTIRGIPETLSDSRHRL